MAVSQGGSRQSLVYGWQSQSCVEDGNHILFLGNIWVSSKGTNKERRPQMVKGKDGLFGADDACFISTWTDFGPCPPTNKTRQLPVVLSLMIAIGVTLLTRYGCKGCSLFQKKIIKTRKTNDILRAMLFC